MGLFGREKPPSASGGFSLQPAAAGTALVEQAESNCGGESRLITAFSAGSLVPQRINRICLRRSQGLRADGQGGDGQGQGGGKWENPRADVRPDGKIPEPDLHDKIRSRPSENVGQDNPLDEFFRKMEIEAPIPSSQDFPDADLLGFLFHRMGGQPEKAQEAIVTARKEKMENRSLILFSARWSRSKLASRNA